MNIEEAVAIVERNEREEISQFLRRLSMPEKRRILSNEAVQKGLRSSLFTAIYQNKEDVVEFLLEECDISLREKDDDGLMPLYKAVYYNRTGMVRKFLRHATRPKVSDEGNERLSCRYVPMVFLALEHHNAQVLKLLLDTDEGLHMNDCNGEHCLSRAAMLNDVTLVRYILDAGAQGTRISRSDYTDALLAAVMYSTRDVVELLWPFRERTASSRWRLFLYATASRPWKLDIAYRVIEEAPISEQITMHEFLGVLHVRENELGFAYSWWCKAMNLRWRDEKNPVLKTENTYTHADGQRTREVQTLKDLKDLDTSPNSMKLQAFLVAKRIYFTQLISPTFVLHVMGVASIENDLETMTSIIERCVNLDVTTLEVSNFYHDLFNDFLAFLDGESQDLMFKTVLPLLDLVNSAQQLIRPWMGAGKHSKSETQSPLQENKCTGCKYVEECQQDFHHALSLLLRLRETASLGDMHELDRKVCLFVRNNPRVPGLTLFLAQEDGALDPDVICKLVKCSALEGRTSRQKKSPLHLAVDHLGRTPLHLLAEYRDIKNTEIVECFVANGEHLCTRDLNGRRILDVLERRGVDTRCWYPLSLKCLAARVVRQTVHELPKEVIPEEVYEFLQYH